MFSSTQNPARPSQGRFNSFAKFAEQTSSSGLVFSRPAISTLQKPTGQIITVPIKDGSVVKLAIKISSTSYPFGRKLTTESLVA